MSEFKHKRTKIGKYSFRYRQWVEIFEPIYQSIVPATEYFKANPNLTKEQKNLFWILEIEKDYSTLDLSQTFIEYFDYTHMAQIAIDLNRKKFMGLVSTVDFSQDLKYIKDEYNKKLKEQYVRYRR